MKLIGLTQRVTVDPRHGERRDALDQRWPRLLERLGFAAVPLPNHMATAKELFLSLKLGGLILTGGDSLVAYGGETPERDETEAMLLALALRQGIPVLGVCRGMQVILDGFGVPLIFVEGHVAVSHAVTCPEGARRTVNSFHQLASREAGEQFKILALSDDGLVEAIRHRGSPVVGVLWHPERETVLADQDAAMFMDLFGGEP